MEVAAQHRGTTIERRALTCREQTERTTEIVLVLQECVGHVPGQLAIVSGRDEESLRLEHLPEEVVEWADLEMASPYTREGDSLIGLNDRPNGLSFGQIADVVEAEF